VFADSSDRPFPSFRKQFNVALTSFSTNFVESNFLFNKSSVLCAIARLLQRPDEKSGED
jgi:hypothetical protein